MIHFVTIIHSGPGGIWLQFACGAETQGFGFTSTSIVSKVTCPNCLQAMAEAGS